MVKEQCKTVKIQHQSMFHNYVNIIINAKGSPLSTQNSLLYIHVHVVNKISVIIILWMSNP